MSLRLDHSSVIPADAIIIFSDVAQSVPARMREIGSTEKERPARAGFSRGSQSARQSTSHPASGVGSSHARAAASEYLENGRRTHQRQQHNLVPETSVRDVEDGWNGAGKG